MNPARWQVFAALAAGVLIVSTASILIRWAQAEGVPSLAIAAWRLTLAALVLAPLVWFKSRDEIAAMPRRTLGLALASGVFLALHFASWIASLEYTSVASSVALVTTNPIWIALFSVLVLRERMPALRLAAVTLALAGSGVILWADSGAATATATAPQPAFGNTLALIGSLTVCGYLLIGQKLRAGMSLIAYIGLVYTCAAVCLMAAALASGTALSGYSAVAWACLAGMALGPQLMGHGAFNYALKHVTPTTIALTVLGEPVGSALLAWLLFGEAISAVKLAGMAFLLGGIFLAARSEGGPGQDTVNHKNT